MFATVEYTEKHVSLVDDPPDAARHILGMFGRREAIPEE
jgi:hypothetical protein